MSAGGQRGRRSSAPMTVSFVDHGRRAPPRPCVVLNYRGPRVLGRDFRRGRVDYFSCLPEFSFLTLRAVGMSSAWRFDSVDHEVVVCW